MHAACSPHPRIGEVNVTANIRVQKFFLRPASKRGSMQKVVKSLMIANMIGAFNASGWTQDLDTGKLEFLSNCAPCHGPDAKGNGPDSVKLQTKPADLTTLAKKNNGVFPLSTVYATIDGRNVTETHGIRDMPIWGCRHTPSPIPPTNSSKSKVYKPDPYESHLDLSCDSEDIIANRVLSVIEYLRRIQEK